MASGFNIDLIGDKELAEQFRTMPDKIQASLLRTSFRDALKPVLTQAKKIARRKSGAMARTLKIKAMKRKKGRVGFYIRTGTRAELQQALSKRGAQLAQRVLGGGRYTKKTRRQLQVIGGTLRRFGQGKQGYYPAQIELGNRRQPAYSYLRVPFDAQKEQMVTRVGESINQALDEAL